jgi:hypothetical protein
MEPQSSAVVASCPRVAFEWKGEVKTMQPYFIHSSPAWVPLLAGL